MPRSGPGIGPRSPGVKTPRWQGRSPVGTSRAGPAELLRVCNLDHPILVRPATPDITTIINNIVREEYGRSAPARISDQTPFRVLEREGAGYDLPPLAPDRFVVAIEAMAMSSAEQRARARTAARRLAEARSRRATRSTLTARCS